MDSHIDSSLDNGGGLLIVIGVSWYNIHYLKCLKGIFSKETGQQM